MFETVKAEVDGRGVATLTLNRGEKHNALSSQLIGDIHAATNMLRDDKSVRVIVLTGAGKSFCAGGDLRWMQDQMQADGAQRAAEARKLANMLKALNEMPKPVIGRIQGQAFGGGIGMASVCDVAIGVQGSRFGLTETKLGVIPATIAPYVVARMGEAKARRVFMSSRIFDADEAVTLGILARAVAPEALDAAIEAEIAPYMACAPGAVADAKALARRLGPRIDDAVIDATIAVLVKRWEGEEAVHGIQAFFAKEKPSWDKR